MVTIGNIQGRSHGQQLYIYDAKTSKPKACIVLPDDTLLHRDLMSEHYLQFSFNWVDRLNFVRTDYIDFRGNRYYLRRNYKPTETNNQEYKYMLKFESFEMLFRDFIFFYHYQNLKEAEWTLTGTAGQFLQIAADNINKYFNSDEWKMGIVEPAETMQH